MLSLPRAGKPKGIAAAVKILAELAESRLAKGYLQL